MNTLVLGSSGMLGHKMLERLRLRRSNVYGLTREDGLDVYDPYQTRKLIDRVRPHVIVNCVGYIKQRGSDESCAVRVNTWFPHWLQRLCEGMGVKLIHFSTDCVFSGKKGGYVETDLPDAEDIYGYTKFMGDVLAPNALTIRTSIVGRELKGYHGLLEWFLSQPKGSTIDGHVGAIYSGVTTNWIADRVGSFSEDIPSGLYHVAGEAVSKYDLLNLFKEVYNKNVNIRPVTEPVCDRSLNGRRFTELTGIDIPSQRSMLFYQREQDRYESLR